MYYDHKLTYEMIGSAVWSTVNVYKAMSDVSGLRKIQKLTFS